MELVTLAEYARLWGVSLRTAERWRDDGELPAARRHPDRRWYIPPDALRQVRQADMSPTRRSDVVVSERPAAPQGLTLAAALERLPALLTPEQAAPLLGIPAAAIRDQAEEIGAVPWGPLRGGRRTWRVPARVVRDLAGLL